MFLTTSSIRPFAQNENGTGFKKPGASKSGGLSLRTPFKDRSVNSVSPTSKFNTKMNMQKKLEQPAVKNIAKSLTSTKLQPMKEEADDIYSNDFASYKEVEDKYADVFPSLRFDFDKLLHHYLSGEASPKYMSDDEDDDVKILPVKKLYETNDCPLPSLIDMPDVPLPVFDF